MADQEYTFENEPVREMYDLVLDLEGFEGPIDLLLTLARQQKVDLSKMSILKLSEQYLAFITAAKQLRLEIAADYLVMAAWLAYLKSRLLLPVTEDEEEASGPELAEALTFQLRRLDAMRNAGEKLLVMPRLGRDVCFAAEHRKEWKLFARQSIRSRYMICSRRMATTDAE